MEYRPNPPFHLNLFRMIFQGRMYSLLLNLVVEEMEVDYRRDGEGGLGRDMTCVSSGIGRGSGR